MHSDFTFKNKRLILTSGVFVCILLKFAASSFAQPISATQVSQSKYIQKVDEVEKLERKVQQLDAAYNITLQKQQEEQQKKIDESKQVVLEWKQKLEQAKSIIQQADRRSEQLMQALDKRAVQIDKLEKQIQDMRESAEQQDKFHHLDLLEQENKYNKKISKMTEDYDGKIKDIERSDSISRKELDRATKAISDLKERLQQTQVTIVEKDERIQSLQEMLKKNQGQLGAFEKQIKAVEKSLESKDKVYQQSLIAQAIGQFNDMVAIYEEKIAALEKREFILQKELGRSDKIIDQLKQRPETVTLTSEEQMDNIIEGLRMQLKESIDQKKSLEQQLQDTEKSLVRQDKVHQLDLLEQKDKYDKQLNELTQSYEKQIIVLKDKSEQDNSATIITGLEQQLLGKQDVIQQKDEKITQLEQALAEPKDGLKQQLREKDEVYKVKINGLEKREAVLQQELDKALTHIAELKQKLQTAEDAAGPKAENMQQIDELSKLVARLKQELTEKEYVVEQKDEKISQLTQLSKENSVQIKKIKAELEDREVQNRKYKQALSAQQAKFEKELQEKTQEYTAKLASFKNQDLSRQQELDRATVVISELRQKLGKAKVAIEQQTQKITQFKNDLDKKDKEAEGLRRQIDRIEADLEQLLK